MSAFLPFLAIVFYISLLVLILKKAKRRWVKWVGALIWVLVPTVDEIVGQYILQTRLCPDSGLRVFQHGDKDGGLLLTSSAPEKSYLKEFGFPFVEGRSGDGQYLKVYLINDQPVQIEITGPTARYELTEWENHPVQLGLIGALLGENLPDPSRNAGGFGGNEYRLFERKTGVVLARFRGYGFKGGWAARTLSMLGGSLGGGSYCERRPREDFPNTMLAKVFLETGTEK